MPTRTADRTLAETRALAELRRAVGHPVHRQRADELEALARSVGARIVWVNVDLTTGKKSEGRATDGK